MNYRKYIFAFITLVIGFMVAIQFQTTNEPEERDTRDIWELRSAIDRTKEEQLQLNTEILKYETLLKKYDEENQLGQIEAMTKSLEELRIEAGLTEIKGEGIIITINYLFTEDLIGETNLQIHPELLRRLINELNLYGATDIAINGQRVTSRTAIREVNGETYINGEPLSSLPIQIKVLAGDATRLRNEMVVSQSLDDFASENLQLKIEKQDDVVLPPYQKPLRVKYMEQVKENT